jgi:hypothetical protein
MKFLSLLLKTYPSMDPHNFESYYREEVRQILDRLQSAMLISSQLEAALADIGDAVQTLSRNVEQYLAEQDSDSDLNPSSSP